MNQLTLIERIDVLSRLVIEMQVVLETEDANWSWGQKYCCITSEYFTSTLTEIGIVPIKELTIALTSKNLTQEEYVTQYVTALETVSEKYKLFLPSLIEALSPKKVKPPPKARTIKDDF